MSRIGKILVATNYSEDARRAENRAAMLSVQLKAGLLELMALQKTRMGMRMPAVLAEAVAVHEDDAWAMLERQEGLRPLLGREDGPSCVRTLREGSPPQAIVERAREIGADLIVVPAQGKRFLADMFATQGNDELIRMADRPVLLVNAEPADAYRSVIVAIDFSEESVEAARVALAIAPSAHITFLHAFRVTDEDMMMEAGVSLDVVHNLRMRAREAARVRLNQLIDSLDPRKQLISRVIQHGKPAVVIGAQARQSNADLIALGKHGKSRFAEFLLGSVTQRLVDAGGCDLLVTAGQQCIEPELRPAA
ncbi:universal stress protein [Noviherbaspirillum denitrificans]|uniref:UspA domain-containing protein n=1 Tax=Noviherbaspirillum denitrificans TaxID=1968433 RepID=A0A254TFL6_9BURK|nr:universal stress protein [Noviherbaspirillum denitrificans]OWW21436.1 hypothetical protein AYR66_20040 [Noviherbaspirillum denitrificans]